MTLQPPCFTVRDVYLGRCAVLFLWQTLHFAGFEHFDLIWPKHLPLCLLCALRAFQQTEHRAAVSTEIKLHTGERYLTID